MAGETALLQDGQHVSVEGHLRSGIHVSGGATVQPGRRGPARGEKEEKQAEDKEIAKPARHPDTLIISDAPPRTAPPQPPVGSFG